MRRQGSLRAHGLPKLAHMKPLFRRSSLIALVVLCLSPAALPAADPNVPAPWFENWPAGTSPREIGARVAARFLPTPHMYWTERGTIHYAEVCTWYGALTHAELAGDKVLTAQLVERFEPFFGPEAGAVPAINHVDSSVFGIVPLEIYRQTGRPRYRMLGLEFADGQWDRPTAEGLTNQTRFWIDDMFMITALQVQASRATGDLRYVDRAANEMAVYLDRLQQPNGLFFHAPDTPFFWGRGNGWMAAGMTELLRSLPEDHLARPRILAGYRAMMASLLKYQAQDGMWRQLIDHPEAWPESSCTGMFTFAFITGVKHGWLDGATYGPAARRAWLQLITYLDDNGDLREVCVGTGTKSDLQYYLDRPRRAGDFHGQAPVLWCASALLR
jgi:unsaturated rhamnogalacturonyl hydrolase